MEFLEKKLNQKSPNDPSQVGESAVLTKNLDSDPKPLQDQNSLQSSPITESES